MKNLPEDYKNRFETVLKGKSFSAGLGRCVLVSRFHYFCGIDLEWTKENMLPLFNFKKNRVFAEQAWNGMLFWGRMPLELFEDFKPLISSAVEKLSDNREGQRERLYALAIDPFLTGNFVQLENNWFYDILRNKKTTEKHRVFIAHRIWDRLRSEKHDYKKKLWKRWLKKYCQDRIGNNPIELSKEETESILQWAPHLQPVFSEVVDVICTMDVSPPEHTLLYTDIRMGNFAETHPKDVNKLLTYILVGDEQLPLHCYELNPIFETLKKSLSDEELKPLLNHLMRLGCRYE